MMQNQGLSYQIYLSVCLSFCSVFSGCSPQSSGSLPISPSATPTPSVPTLRLPTPRVPAPSVLAEVNDSESLRLNSLPIDGASAYVSILDESREDLFRKGRGSFLGVLSALDNIDDIVRRNKARIFRYSFNAAQAYIQNSQATGGDIHQERVQIYTSVNMPVAYNLAFDRVQSPVLIYDRNWMNYSDATLAQNLAQQSYQMTFAKFANNRLGGGWNTHGNVQEEQMAHQCADFAVLLAAFNPERHRHQLYTRKNPVNPSDQENAKYSYDGDTADPKLITHLRCFQKLNGNYERDPRFIYGSLWAPDGNIDPIVFTAHPDAPAINMIAMAAPELRLRPNERGVAYPINLAKDLFNNAYRAFKMVKDYDVQQGYHTHLVLGAWGAGVFGHNLNMSLSMQYLAARLVLGDQDQVRFTGMSADRARTAIQAVDSLIEQSNLSEGARIPGTHILNEFLRTHQGQDWHTRGRR